MSISFCKQCDKNPVARNTKYCSACRSKKYKLVDRKCSRCKVNKVRSQRSYCDDCHEGKHKCTGCGKHEIPFRRKYCPNCKLDRTRESVRKTLEKTRKQYCQRNGFKYTEKGRCVDCNEPTTSRATLRCPPCIKERQREKNRVNYAKRRKVQPKPKKTSKEYFYTGVSILEHKPKTVELSETFDSKHPDLQSAINDYLSKGGKVKRVITVGDYSDDLVIPIDDVKPSDILNMDIEW